MLFHCYFAFDVILPLDAISLSLMLSSAISCRCYGFRCHAMPFAVRHAALMLHMLPLRQRLRAIRC